MSSSPLLLPHALHPIPDPLAAASAPSGPLPSDLPPPTGGGGGADVSAPPLAEPTAAPPPTASGDAAARRRRDLWARQEGEAASSAAQSASGARPSQKKKNKKPKGCGGFKPSGTSASSLHSTVIRETDTSSYRLALRPVCR